MQETRKELKCDGGKNCSSSGVREYARRFLKFVKSSSPYLQAAPPSTPDNMCDPGILETSWDDQLTEVWNWSFSFSAVFQLNTSVSDSSISLTPSFLICRKAYFIQFNLGQWRPTEGPLNLILSCLRYVINI